MVTHANARVYPRTMMVESLDATLAHVAMVGTRQGDHLALETKLMDLESVKELCLSQVGLFADEAWATAPCQESINDEAKEADHGDCLEELK